MSNLDATVASVIDNANSNTISDDEDALIASLEDSPAIDAFREQRIQQLHKEITRAKAQKSLGFGNYTEIKEEKELMDLTTEIKHTVVHFSKDDFARCSIMDRHLEGLAKKHFDTRFLKMNVDNAPFLVVKLKVQVLPCVISFIDGIAVDRIIGFEGLGYTPDNFTTKDLEARLLRSGVIQRSKIQSDATATTSIAQNQTLESDDDDWD